MRLHTGKPASAEHQNQGNSACPPPWPSPPGSFRRDARPVLRRSLIVAGQRMRPPLRFTPFRRRDVVNLVLVAPEPCGVANPKRFFLRQARGSPNGLRRLARGSKLQPLPRVIHGVTEHAAMGGGAAGPASPAQRACAKGCGPRGDRKRDVLVCSRRGHVEHRRRGAPRVAQVVRSETANARACTMCRCRSMEVRNGYSSPRPQKAA